MNNFPLRLFASCLSIVLLTLFSCFPVQCEERAVSEQTFKVLKKADSLLRKGQPEQALGPLRNLQTKMGNDAFEKAVVQQYLAYAYAATGDYRAAKQSARAALESKLLEADAEQGLFFLAGQAAFQLESYRESLQLLEQWLGKEPKANADIYYMTAYAAHSAHLIRPAIRYLEKAVAMQKSPAPEWIQLLLSLYMDNKNFNKAEPMIKRLIALSPTKREWWNYLSSFYARRDRYDQALAAMMLAYYSGAVRPKDVLHVVRLNAQQDYPVKAARLLEAELESKRIPRNYDNLKLLFSCWQLAREHAQAERILAEAAALSHSGEDYVLLGRLAMQRDDWVSAKKNFQKSLRRGGLKRKTKTRLWLGIAALKTDDKALAKQSLEPLLKVADVRQEAEFWLKRLELSKNQRKRQQAGGNPQS